MKRSQKSIVITPLMYPGPIAHSTRFLSLAKQEMTKPSLQTEKISNILLYIHCPPCVWQNISVWLKTSFTESVDVKLKKEYILSSIGLLSHRIGPD